MFDQAFDTLMMINVIEHVENGIRILRNIYNALKPGGLLIFNECVFRVRNFEIPTASTPHAIDATCPKKMHHCATKNSIVDVHTVVGGTAKVPLAKKGACSTSTFSIIPCA